MTADEEYAEGVVVVREWTSQTKEVHLRVEDAPWLTTRLGNTPIDPLAMTITYDIAKPQDDPYVRVVGHTDDHKRRRITRSVGAEWAPPWIRDLIEAYRPSHSEQGTTA